MQESRLHAECPYCGNLMYDEGVEKTNEQMDSYTRKLNIGLVIFFLLLGGLVLGLRMGWFG